MTTPDQRDPPADPDDDLEQDDPYFPVDPYNAMDPGADEEIDGNVDGNVNGNVAMDQHQHQDPAATPARTPAEAPYDGLDPDTLLAALDSIGMDPTGGVLALNSYENRVYQFALESGGFVIGKFYRPDRLSDAAIREEHAFAIELKEEELSCVAPLVIDGETLFEHANFRFALFPRQGGHAPDVESEDNLKILGRALARIHGVGVRSDFQHRPTLTVDRFLVQSRDFLLNSGFIPDELRPAYETTSAHLLTRLEGCLDQAPKQRIHGDCHLGNLLWRDDTPHFLDFDDAMLGPPIQDLWMLISGERSERQRQLDIVLEGYEMFRDLDMSTIGLIEPLRTLRIMHHAAWIGRRWHDPAFPPAFPWFADARYWSDHVLTLREQLAALDEAPLL